MTTRKLLKLTSKPKPAPEPGAPLEWLVANGLGGYASGSVDGPPMRRFHGYLIAALPAPLGRALLLHAMHEVVELAGAPALSLQPGRDGDPPVVPAVSFRLQAGLPHWRFSLAEGVDLERMVFVPHGQGKRPLRQPGLQTEIGVRYDRRIVVAAGQERLRRPAVELDDFV